MPSMLTVREQPAPRLGQTEHLLGLAEAPECLDRAIEDVGILGVGVGELTHEWQEIGAAGAADREDHLARIVAGQEPDVRVVSGIEQRLHDAPSPVELGDAGKQARDIELTQDRGIAGHQADQIGVG